MLEPGKKKNQTSNATTHSTTLTTAMRSTGLTPWLRLARSSRSPRRVRQHADDEEDGAHAQAAVAHGPRTDPDGEQRASGLDVDVDDRAQAGQQRPLPQRHAGAGAAARAARREPSTSRSSGRSNAHVAMPVTTTSSARMPSRRP